MNTMVKCCHIGACMMGNRKPSTRGEAQEKESFFAPHLSSHSGLAKLGGGEASGLVAEGSNLPCDKLFWPFLGCFWSFLPVLLFSHFPLASHGA